MCWEPLPSIPRAPDLRAFDAAVREAGWDPPRLNGNDDRVYKVVGNACALTKRLLGRL